MMHLLCSGCCGVSGGLGLPRGPSDADLAPICQTVSDLRPARATRHRKSTALFSCFLLLPVSTVTASHPHITSLLFSIILQTTRLYETIHIFLEKTLVSYSIAQSLRKCLPFGYFFIHPLSTC